MKTVQQIKEHWGHQINISYNSIQRSNLAQIFKDIGVNVNNEEFEDTIMNLVFFVNILEASFDFQIREAPYVSYDEFVAFVYSEEDKPHQSSLTPEEETVYDQVKRIILEGILTYDGTYKFADPILQNIAETYQSTISAGTLATLLIELNNRKK